MLLSSVILLLQETLEAALLVAVLMATGFLLRCRAIWLPWGLGIGLGLAFLYARNMGLVSEWFDYVGQEVVNAFLQISITILLAGFAFAATRRRVRTQPGGDPGPDSGSRPYRLLAALAVGLAVTREGSEVFLYLGGFLQQGDKLQAVLMGSGIGFSIGLSLGFLLYYGLVGLRERWGFSVSLLLLALTAGNMLAQATLQLIQADWITSTRTLWDTSALVPEHSISGQLLYALVGYEATPSPVQVASYLVGAACVILAVVLGRSFAARSLPK